MDETPRRVEPPPGPAEDMRPQGGPAPQHAPGHETSDVSVRGIFQFTAALAVFAVLFHIGFAMVMAHFGDRATRLESRRPPRYDDPFGQFPAPNLQESPNAEMAALRLEDQAEEVGYRWVDKKARVARLPILRAMEVVAANQGKLRRGADAKKTDEPTKGAEPKKDADTKKADEPKEDAVTKPAEAKKEAESKKADESKKAEPTKGADTKQGGPQSR